ncbi:MAG: hypothetical protein K6T65_06980 [Peptococcaceae bacterium]|nr:hypothetical protein [Peptococcaceae bacterium]
MSDKEWFELGLDEGTPNAGQATEEQDKAPVTEHSPQEATDEEDFGKLDAAKEEELDFWEMVEEQEKEQGKQQKGKKKKNGCATGCGATSKVGKTTTPTPPPPKEPPKDLPLLVVLTNYNIQKEYPAGMTLEEIRQDLELEYPAYSANNTSWYFEEQRDKNRVLCIPSVKSNKAG